MTPELEKLVRSHYGLATRPTTETKSGYGAYYPGDAERAEREHRGHDVELPGAQTVPSEAGQVRDLGNLPGPGTFEDELRVRRSEEELKVGTRDP